MSKLYDVGLSVRTVHILGKCGVETSSALSNLNLLELIRAGGGLVALADAREAQLRLAGHEVNAQVDEESILTTCHPIGEEDVRSLQECLRQAGWEPREDSRWKYWNRDEGAVNFVRLHDRSVVDILLTQRDARIRTFLQAANSLDDLFDVVVGNADDTTFARRAEFFEAVRPHLQEAWVETRGGFVPTFPPAET